MVTLALARPPRPRTADALGAAMLWLPTFATCVGLGWPSGNSPFGAFLAFAWSLLFCVPLAWRRVAPDAAALALVVPHLIQLPSGIPQFGNIGVPIMMYAVAAYGREEWRRAWLTAGLIASLLAGISWTIVGSRGHLDLAQTTLAVSLMASGCAGLVAAAWALGAVRRARISEVTAQRERASAEWREQAQARELTLTTERQRIAREMHDIVAHSLSVIVIQADGAHYVAAEAPGTPEERLAAVAKAIETIQTTARAALADTRRMVGVLHSSEGLEFSPAATLEAIPELIEGVTSAGRDARLDVVGTPQQHPALGATAELAAYRVVQEGLTNVLKHAGPTAAASVSLIHTPTGLTVIVRDDGPGATASDGAGHGLIGMRERVSAVGGTLSTRNIPSGGFEVVATFPATPSKERR